MTADPERLAQLRDLADRVGRTGHDDLPVDTIDAVSELSEEVESHLENEDSLPGARKLLAFWDAFVQTKLETGAEDTAAIASRSIARFEQAFDAEIIGIDLYQALETLAIVEDMDDSERDLDRLTQWASRVQMLTEEFATHLQGHAEE